MTRVESGCNCRHLADSARCHHCQLRESRRGLGFMDDDSDDGPDTVLLTDGGMRAPKERPESTGSDVSPAVVDALESRVDSLEDAVDGIDQTNTDVVAMVNDLQSKVRDLQERVDDLEGDR